MGTKQKALDQAGRKRNAEASHDDYSRPIIIGLGLSNAESQSKLVTAKLSIEKRIAILAILAIKE